MLGLMIERLGTGWSVSYRIPTWLWWGVVFVTGEGLLVAGGVVFIKVAVCVIQGSVIWRFGSKCGVGRWEICAWVGALAAPLVGEFANGGV